MPQRVHFNSKILTLIEPSDKYRISSKKGEVEVEIDRLSHLISGNISGLRRYYESKE
jgi:hypothetical protein